APAGRKHFGLRGGAGQAFAPGGCGRGSVWGALGDGRGRGRGYRGAPRRRAGDLCWADRALPPEHGLLHGPALFEVRRRPSQDLERESAEVSAEGGGARRSGEFVGPGGGGNRREAGFLIAPEQWA